MSHELKGDVKAAQTGHSFCECACGWTSTLRISTYAAINEFNEHKREADKAESENVG